MNSCDSFNTCTSLSHDSNRSFLGLFASSAMFGLLHEIPGAKKQVKGIAFKFCGVQEQANLFSGVPVSLSLSKPFQAILAELLIQNSCLAVVLIFPHTTGWPGTFVYAWRFQHSSNIPRNFLDWRFQHSTCMHTQAADVVDMVFSFFLTTRWPQDISKP